MHVNNGVIFSADISRESIEKLLEVLKRRGGYGTNVIIDSNGGTFDFFSFLAGPLVNFGYRSVAKNVASAAIILHLLGAEKVALPEATFFFHEVRAMPNGQAITIYDLEDALTLEQNILHGCAREHIEEYRLSMRNAQSWMIDLVSRHSKISPNIFLDLMKEEETLNAKDALRYGIIQKII